MTLERQFIKYANTAFRLLSVNSGPLQVNAVVKQGVILSPIVFIISLHDFAATNI